MIPLSDLTLTELAAYIANALGDHGIDVAVVGGSAVTAHAPNLYTSEDVDFAVLSAQSTHEIGLVLTQLGFVRQGRVWQHADVKYTLDFVAHTPYIDQRPISDFTEVATRVGGVKVYRIEDAIADRLAHFIHWSDTEALTVAEGLTQLHARSLPRQALATAIDSLTVVGDAECARLSHARRRLLHHDVKLKPPGTSY